MTNKILGIHHITAIAGNAQRNYDFYTKTLGLRFVKKTVNFDDPGTYHFYFGNEKGSPGTILTFFPWAGVPRGRAGVGSVTEIGYSVPKGSLEFWKKQLANYIITNEEEKQRFGEDLIRVEDPDGLVLVMVEPAAADARKAWTGNGIDEENAMRGFYTATLSVRKMEPTARILTDIFGYELLKQEENRYRLKTDGSSGANYIDILEEPNGKHSLNGVGINHHIAFRAKNDELMMEFREKVVSAGLNITEKIDRNYFFSLYFREPNGILFEIASDNPGFTADESLEELGKNLKLPPQYESAREKIEATLPPLNQ
jgi:glyoxalase family protein